MVKISHLLIVGAILLVQLLTIECAKKNDGMKLIQKIEDVKAFKKLLRTKTNILTLFAKNEKGASSKLKVMAETAVKAKGIGTLAWINCDKKDGKKICKKYKQGSNELVHFKDGELSSTYDRKLSVLSMYHFLKDPKSDGPWSEEDSASDVIHLNTEKQLNSLLKKNKPTIIMFYAPWCGHCKRFKPVFAEVATEMKGQVVLAGYDADTNADSHKIRERFNVTGFPKTLYFEKGSYKFDYSAGHKKEDLVRFLEDPSPPKPKEPEVEWSDAENDVSHLTEENFEEFIQDNDKVLLFFYAPWCGHCKNLKPEWDKAATQMKEEEIDGKLAALDATKHPKIANDFKVTGYPTIVYFELGEKKYTVGGAMKRSQEGIIEYIKNPTEPPPPEKSWEEVESEVLHLKDDSFKSQLKKKKHALVMFYAPWCGHCKKAKPEFQNAAEQFKDDKKIAFAAVDCTVSRDVCSKLDVKGYPTFYYLSYGKNEEKYQLGRNEDSYVRYMNNKLGSESKANRKKSRFWKGIDNNEYVTDLTGNNYKDFFRSNSKVLIMVYNVKCPNCQVARQQFADAAKQLDSEGIEVSFASIDGEKHHEKITALWRMREGTPTIYWVQGGKKQFEYIGQRAQQDIINFVKNPQGPKKRVVYDPWEEKEDSHVTHLSGATFSDFVEDQGLVLFYSLKCEKSFKIRKSWEKAAKKLERQEINMKLGAVNIDDNVPLKELLKIKDTPYIGYFKSGEFKFRYNGKTKSKSIVKFCKDPVYTEPPVDKGVWTGTDVEVLDKNNFENIIGNTKHVLVMFQAKWCGHCRNFKPKFAEAATLLKSDENVRLGAVDVDQSGDLMKEFGVRGLPTVLYFMDGKMKEKYNRNREAKDVVKYMKSKAKGTSDESEFLKNLPSDVTSLTPDDLESFLKSSEEAFVMFYAPWCPACKSAKSEFFETSSEISEELPDTKLAIMNADKYKEQTKKFNVKGYPTFWYFKNGEPKFKYNGPISKRNFAEFLNDPVETKSEEDTLEDNWSENIKKLQTENFEDFMKVNQHVLLFFYIKHCQICLTSVKDEIEKAAKTAESKNIKTKLAVLRCDTNKKLGEKLGVDSYPSFIYFENGEKKFRYQTYWSSEKLLKFMENPVEKHARKIKPVSWQDKDVELSGKVEHLSNTTFDQFINKYEYAIVMFHSLYSPQCEKPREYMRDASLSNQNENVGFGAVDCYRSPEQGVLCYQHSIKKRPTYEYYNNGKLVDPSVNDFTSSENIVNFIDDKIKNKNESEKEDKVKDEL